MTHTVTGRPSGWGWTGRAGGRLRRAIAAAAACGWLAVAALASGCGAAASSGGVVQVDPQGKQHDLSGKASWYGDRFHGKKTASGEAFDMHALTAAHKTLPFGTLVEVTRHDTGQAVVVRVTDRGPFVRGRVIDLSKGAAQRIDMVRAGVVPVQLKVLQWGQGKRRR